jgi:hypothetical protein
VMIRHEGKNIYYRINKSCVVECCAEILKRYNISFQWY